MEATAKLIGRIVNSFLAFDSTSAASFDILIQFGLQRKAGLWQVCCYRSSLRDMIKPGALAIISPIAVGRVFRVLGYYAGNPLLGAKLVASVLMFATVSRILMALFLNTSVGAWDNAKKYNEIGALGGNGSECHKAAITEDTMGPGFDYHWQECKSLFRREDHNRMVETAKPKQDPNQTRTIYTSC